LNEKLEQEAVARRESGVKLGRIIEERFAALSSDIYREIKGKTEELEAGQEILEERLSPLITAAGQLSETTDELQHAVTTRISDEVQDLTD
jgi:hypothetical protein